VSRFFTKECKDFFILQEKKTWQDLIHWTEYLSRDFANV